MSDQPNLELVVRTLDGTEVRRVPVRNPTTRKVTRVLWGLVTNMDTKRFFVDDSAFDHLYESER